ncbi:hypothetical protein GCM10023116_39100 [Kistimonas scapharcae]|uniref:Uncharacterized protein n=1 Tax=Kistimonas scapharcae TaxID=1036133 RepID=A0ABP8V6V9_9GAMM
MCESSTKEEGLYLCEAIQILKLMADENCHTLQIFKSCLLTAINHFRVISYCLIVDSWLEDGSGEFITLSISESDLISLIHDQCLEPISEAYLLHRLPNPVVEEVLREQYRAQSKTPGEFLRKVRDLDEYISYLQQSKPSPVKQTTRQLAESLFDQLPHKHGRGAEAFECLCQHPDVEVIIDEICDGDDRRVRIKGTQEQPVTKKTVANWFTEKNKS